MLKIEVSPEELRLLCEVTRDPKLVEAAVSKTHGKAEARLLSQIVSKNLHARLREYWKGVSS